VASGVLTVVAVALLVLGLGIRSAATLVAALGICVAAVACLLVAVRRWRTATSSASPASPAEATAAQPAVAPPVVAAPIRVTQSNVLVRPAQRDVPGEVAPGSASRERSGGREGP
jgi:hypothetical protein